MGNTPRKFLQALDTMSRWNSGEEISRASMITFFSDLRQSVEASKLSKAPEINQLGTVCDWLLHEKLTGKKHFHALARVSKTVHETKARHHKEFASKFSASFFDQRLLLEGIDFLVGRLTPKKKVELSKAQWLSLTSMLILELSNKPLSIYRDGEKTIEYEVACQRVGVTFSEVAVELKITQPSSSPEFDVDLIVRLSTDAPIGDNLSIQLPLKLTNS